MRDKSKQLLVINTGKKKSEQTGMPSQSGTTHIIGGGGLSVNMSDYLLKSIWDKVFEIRTDSQGTEYIFGKLPVVTQYGITMYSGDGVDVPSLASGLPFDGRTIWYNPDTQQIEVIGGTGGGSGEGVSNFWDLSGIPSWITNSKPKYTYSEIEGTPDLSGFATQNWIMSQGYASAEELKKYIPISGYTEVSGEKNFTGGLKVNGSPIYYDTEKKYWKLEGDLLVTGGVTMYGNDSSFTPSTIMDAIAVDGTTISKSGGVLKVIGGTGGGVADSVAWANITGKPTWIGSSKPTYSYSEITGAISTTELQNYLTQNSYLNVTSGDNRYLKLSGGTINGTSNSPFTVNTSSQAIELQLKSNSNIKAYIGWNTTDGVFLQEGENTAYIGVQTNKNPYYYNGTRYTLWHAGNDGSGSGLDADLLDGQEETTFAKWKSGISSSNEYRHIGYAYGSRGWKTSGAAMSFGADKNFFMQIQGGGSKNKDVFLYARYIYEGIYSDWKTIAFTDSNVASATTVMMNYSYNQDVNYPLVFTSRDNIGVAQNATLYIDFSGRPTYNPKTDTLTVGNLSGNATYATNSSKLYSTDIIYSYGSTNPYYGYLTFNNTYGEWDFKVSPSTPEYIHVYSSDKLRTARTIWGQSFDGTGNVSGRLDMDSLVYFMQGGTAHGYLGFASSGTDLCLSANRTLFISGKNNLILNGYSDQGNVGIGTTSPNKKLHVEGGVQVNGQIIGANSIVSNTTNGYFVGNRNDGLGVTDGGLLLYTYGKTPISFYANGEHMRINSSGNVGIGTTNPSEKLHVDGSVIFEGSNKYLILNRKSSDGGILFKHNGTNKWQVVNYDNGLNFYDYSRQITALIIGTDGVMKFDGNILATGAMTFYSMRKLKNVVDERGLSLSELSTIKPTRYTWKDGRDNRLHFGGIADDIQQVLPEVVYSTSDGILTMDYGNAAFAIASSLIQPVVDHEKRIAMLEAENKELRNELERLKAS